MKPLKVPLIIFFFVFVHSSDIFVTAAGANRIPSWNGNGDNSDGANNGSKKLDLDLSEGEPVQWKLTEDGWKIIDKGDNCDGCNGHRDDDDGDGTRPRPRPNSDPFPIVSGYIQHTKIKRSHQPTLTPKPNPHHGPSASSISSSSSSSESGQGHSTKSYDNDGDIIWGTPRKQLSRRSVHFDVGFDHGDHYHHVPLIGLGYGGYDGGYGFGGDYHHHHDYDDYHHHHGHHHHHH